MTMYEFASDEMHVLLDRLEAHGVGRDLIREVYDRHVIELAHKVDKAQYDVFEITTRIENKLDADIAARLGETNGMLADLLAASRKQEAAVTELRAEFQETGEHLSDLSADVAELREREDACDRDRIKIHELLTELQAALDDAPDLARRLLTLERELRALKAGTSEASS